MRVSRVNREEKIIKRCDRKNDAKNTVMEEDMKEIYFFPQEFYRGKKDK